MTSAFIAFLCTAWFGGTGQDSDTWNQFRGDAANTGVSSATIAPPFKQKWLAPIGIVNSSPSVVGNTVYVGSYDGHLYAVDAPSGKVRWRLLMGKPVYASRRQSWSVPPRTSAKHRLNGWESSWARVRAS